MFTGLTLLAGCAAEAASESDELPATAAFSTAPLEPNHESITVRALGFLRADMLGVIVLGNTSTDAAFVLDNATHFDDCNFSGGSARIRNAQRDAVRALNPRQTGNDRQAALLFARSLHSAQDFYAHSNWVELGGTALVDSSLGAFPMLTPYSTLDSSGFVVVEGAAPAELSLQRDEEASYPDYAVVYVDDAEAETRGLISGTVDYEPGNKCPSEIALTHEELNKDKSSQTDRRAQHDAAMELATRQTRHEWCRLQELTRASWGEAGVRRLNGWVRSGASAPACGGE